MSTLLDNIRASIPTTVGKWWSIVLLLLGGWLGWLVHPLVWFGSGPFRWASVLLATAAQESGYNSGAYNSEDGHENGGSVGMLQFQEATWLNITGRSLDDRSSAFLQGFYAARYVQLAMLADWRWWSCAIPLFGFGVYRVMWGHGISASSAAYVWERAPLRLSTENRSFAAFLLWRGITLGPAVVVGLALFRAKVDWARLRKLV